MTTGIRAAERPAPALRVELTSPGTIDGARTYHVDYVGRDGRRCRVWAGESYIEAAVAAIDATAGQRAQMNSMRLSVHHHESGWTWLAAKSGPGVHISIRPTPTMVQTW